MTDPTAAREHYEEGEPEMLTVPDDPEHVERVREIAAEHGFPLSDWQPTIPDAANPRDREALEAIAAMRKNWQTFTSEWPYNVIDAFWHCVETAEAALKEADDADA